MGDTCHYKFVQTQNVQHQDRTPVKYRLWMIVMCQCRSISCYKWGTIVKDVDNGEDYAHGVASIISTFGSVFLGGLLGIELTAFAMKPLLILCGGKK